MKSENIWSAHFDNGIFWKVSDRMALAVSSPISKHEGKLSKLSSTNVGVSICLEVSKSLQTFLLIHIFLSLKSFSLGGEKKTLNEWQTTGGRQAASAPRLWLCCVVPQTRYEQYKFRMASYAARSSELMHNLTTTLIPPPPPPPRFRIPFLTLE